MITVYMDTNFLLIPGQFKVDVFEQLRELMDQPFKVVVLKQSVEELKRIAKGSGKNAGAARIGLELVKKVKIVEGEGHADDILAEKKVVCTQDYNLKKRVKENGGKVITLRQKKYLFFL